MNVTIVKSNDTLNGLTGYVTASGTSVASSLGFTTSTASVTAIITGIVISSVNAGYPVFTAPGSKPFYITADPNIYPVSVSTTLSTSNISVSAVGHNSANGAQVLTYVVSLSTSCLYQPTTAAATTQTVDVSAQAQTFTTTITAANTPYQGFPSLAEFLRLQALNG